ncbi:O-antigen ligase family protein [Flavobacterium sp.]|uniref:O-antigen ligase family protein n=1 Tax=Flavobacterium sp. TaxID=239 RepID=UPI002B4ABF9E|nr:O-antigen ligase family protein [Flavobacterium sp.]HLF52419.1 O-antigen ligase family protein [Flavobacterium sp.]
MRIDKKNSYIILLLIHAAIGVAVFTVPFLSKIYSLLIFGFCIYYLIKTQNRNNEALVLSAYVVGVEVLLRMTDGMHFNEYAKYSVMIFLFIGMIYTGFSKNSYLYWIFLILLVPSVVLSSVTLNFETNIRKAIAFNISGPVCLGVSAIYCYQRRITLDRLKEVLTAFCFPLVSIVIYLYLYTPSIKDVVTSTQSNFETSGGFGPNQMATILGFGIFLFFVQMLINSSSIKLQSINAALVLVFAFRGIVTFSRGGVITGILMIILLLLVLYFRASLKGKSKIGIILIFSFLASLGVWGYSSAQTSGLIDKRYANEDARGRKKESVLTGREQLIASEFQMFLDNPIFGVGVGKNKEYREEQTGIVAASHNELTRMLAEHGSLGLLGLLILLFTPLLLYLNNQQNIFVLCFLVFWLLTINHAAMRMAAPAFVYALSLLKVYSVEKPTVPRE